MNAENPTAGLLDGVVVLDLSMFVAGPFATMNLADMGAEVLKIEPIGGDPVRSSGIGPQIRGESAQFQSYNRNKQSLCIDLKSEAGRAVFLDLVRTADIVFDNFRPGVLERLELDYDRLKTANPAIISVSLSAFGQDGPWATRPGYDIIVQALSGTMSLTGHDSAEPARIPLHLGDTVGGLYAALAMTSALAKRARSGHGSRLDISLLDCQLALLGDEVTHYGASGTAPGPYGAAYPYLAPYAAFQTADRPIVIAAVGVEKFFVNLAKAIGRPELADDPRFKGNRARAQNRKELDTILGEILATAPRQHWLDLLASNDVPIAPVLDVGEAIGTPQALHREMTQEIALRSGDSAVVARSPIRERDSAPHSVREAPEAGGDTRTVLAKRLGYDEKAIRSLFVSGAVA